MEIAVTALLAAERNVEINHAAAKVLSLKKNPCGCFTINNS